MRCAMTESKSTRISTQRTKRVWDGMRGYTCSAALTLFLRSLNHCWKGRYDPRAPQNRLVVL